MDFLTILARTLGSDILQVDFETHFLNDQTSEPRAQIFKGLFSGSWIFNGPYEEMCILEESISGMLTFDGAVSETNC